MRTELTNTDLQRLRPVIDQPDTPASDTSDGDQRAAHVVTVNTEVVYEDCATGVQRRVTVVSPKDADAGRGHISVLAPIGSALLGLRVGQTIEWQVPSGSKQLRVLEIRDQGHFER